MTRLLSIVITATMLSFVAKAAQIDASILPQCLQAAENQSNTTLPDSLYQHEAIILLRENIGHDYQLSLEQIQKHKKRLQYYIKSLPEIQANLPSIVEEATIFLGKNILPDDQKIYFICGAHSDGFGFQANGKTQLFINLPQIQPDFLPSLLRHEIWHAAFRAQHKTTTNSYAQNSDALSKLAFIMLNEGVGHYYSFQRRVEPTITYTN